MAVLKLLFKQKMFSWLGSYTIYDENQVAIFEVNGKLSWRHKLEIWSPQGVHLGTIQKKWFTLLPRFEMLVNGRVIGEIKKNVTFFKDRYTLDCKDWQIVGDFWGWNYQVIDGQNRTIMVAKKEVFHWTDTYTLEIMEPEHALFALMIVLAIDVAKASSKNSSS